MTKDVLFNIFKLKSLYQPDLSVSGIYVKTWWRYQEVQIKVIRTNYTVKQLSVLFLNKNVN